MNLREMVVILFRHGEPTDDGITQFAHEHLSAYGAEIAALHNLEGALALTSNQVRATASRDALTMGVQWIESRELALLNAPLKMTQMRAVQINAIFNALKEHLEGAALIVTHQEWTEILPRLLCDWMGINPMQLPQALRSGHTSLKRGEGVVFDGPQGTVTHYKEPES